MAILEIDNSEFVIIYSVDVKNGPKLQRIVFGGIEGSGCGERILYYSCTKVTENSEKLRF